MKRFLLTVICAFMFVVTLSACGGNTAETPKVIENVTFESQRVLEDGEEHGIYVSGTIPDGVSVEYENNTATKTGLYKAKATLSGSGYVTLVLDAELEIYTNPIEGITFSGKKFVYTGKPHSIYISGTIPDGVKVEYENNTATEAGVYNATATLSGIGYTTLVLNATFEINSVTDIAADILYSLTERPEPWNFIPEGLQMENMAYTTIPQNDFSDFVNVSDVGRKTIGKQLNVVYDTLQQTETLLGYFDTLSNIIETVVNVYQDYINNNPDSYKEFSGEVAGFKIKITLNDEENALLAGNSAVSIEIAENLSDGTRYGRLQITDGFALKYQLNDDSLKIALKGVVQEVGFLRQIEFVRDVQNRVTGYMYEYLSAESVAVKTSALIYADQNRTVVMSNKRESDDLPIKGYQEIYDSKTGEMIGGEVTETLKLGTFDTLWFPLHKVSGITSVKAVKKADAEGVDKNTVNLDYIYLNGSQNVLETAIVLITQTREFDVEMKDVWYVVKVVGKNGKITYKKQKCSVPMLFIQTKYFDNFSKDIVSKNKNKTEFATTPAASLAAKNELVGLFETMYDTYETIKELVSFQSIIDYIGKANAFFE